MTISVTTFVTLSNIPALCIPEKYPTGTLIISAIKVDIIVSVSVTGSRWAISSITGRWNFREVPKSRWNTPCINLIY